MSTKSILLIDDDCDTLLVIGDRCRQMGLDVRCAHNLLAAIAMVEAQVPDLICIDVQTSSGNGLRFCDMLADDAEMSRIPVIVLTGRQDEATKGACQRMGAHLLPKRPGMWTELVPLVEQLLTGPPAAVSQPRRGAAATGCCSVPPEEHPDTARPPAPVAQSRTVIVADEEPAMVELLTERFTQLGCSVIGVADPAEALGVIYRTLPDLVCIDVDMPAGNGQSVCQMLISDGILRSTPAIVLTGEAGNETVRHCHDMMIYDVREDGDVWGRIEPLARRLLGLVGRQPSTIVNTRSWSLRPKAGSPASSGEAARGHAAEGATARPTAENPVATITTATLEATSLRPAEPPTADEALLDAVFSMVGGRGADTMGVDSSNQQGRQDSTKAHSDDPPWVLCIDDDADFSQALKCRLETCGVAVIRAYSGMEGYRLAFTRPASAILLDYNMPDGQGDYILSRLQNNPVTKPIPVIVITGERDRMLRRRMLSLGAREFFTKPVKFEQLRDALAQHIDILAGPVG